MSRIAPLSVGVALGLIFSATWRWLGPTGQPPRRGERRPPIQDLLVHNHARLALEADTLARALALAAGATSALDGYHARIAEQRAQPERLLDQPPVDRAALATQVARIGELETQLRIRELEVMLRIRALLSPEQVEALRGLHAPPPGG